MKPQEQNFCVAASARLLTPDTGGAQLLWQAVEQRNSLRARLTPNSPLWTMPEMPQRVYCESSGSTGAAKLIRRSPASWIASFEINRSQFGLGAVDSYAVLGHLGHSLSLYAALEAMHVGAGLALLTDLRPNQQAAMLRQHQISTIYATPSQLQLITRADSGAFPAVKLILFGGGRADPSLRQLLAQQFPAARLVEFFGASETSFITMSDGQTPAASVGRPYPGVSLRIGEGLPTGDTGEIWVKSPYLFEAYETGDSPLTRWSEDYLSIGELGRIDQGGFVYLQGRRSRMVTVAAQNVYPEAIETVLLAQAGVQAAAVITPHDPLRGHSVVAAVVGQVRAAELRQACRAQLGDAAVPRTIWCIEAMPMLPAGKPDLQRLDALWQEQTA